MNFQIIKAITFTIKKKINKINQFNNNCYLIIAIRAQNIDNDITTLTINT